MLLLHVVVVVVVLALLSPHAHSLLVNPGNDHARRGPLVGPRGSGGSAWEGDMTKCKGQTARRRGVGEE